MALRDDQDTQNRQVGNEELEFYSRELGLAAQLSSTDNVKASKQSPKTLKYNDGFQL